MDTSFLDYSYPSLADIRVNSAGMLCMKSHDSDMMIIKTLEQLFTPWYIKRY